MARPRKAAVQVQRDSKGKVRAYKVRWTYGTPQSLSFPADRKAHAVALMDVLNDPKWACNLAADDERVRTGSIYGAAPTATVKPRRFEDVALEAIARKHRDPADPMRQRYEADLTPGTGVLAQFLHRDVHSLTTDELRAWIDGMRLTLGKRAGQVPSKSTRINRQIVMRMTLIHAKREGYIPRNPLEGVPRVEGTDMLADTAERVLLNDYGDPQWVQAVIAETTDEHLYADLFRFMAWTGLRIGEALGLQVKHVQLRAAKGAHVQVRQQVLQKQRRIGKPKTKASVRDAYLFAEPVALLQRLCKGKGPDDWVFPCQFTPGLPMLQHTVRHRWNVARAKAGHADLTMHDLRHHFATYGLAHGMDVHEVQHQLGHSRKSTTERIYLHADPATGKAVRTVFAGWGKPEHDKAHDEVAAARARRRRSA